MSGKALWFIPSARTIPVFWDFVSRVDYVDKLIVRNYQWDTAVNIARYFFFKQDYDYFIICSDDVMGYPDHLKMLIQDTEEHGFPVISGWCNHIAHKASLSVEPIDEEVLKNGLERPFPGLALGDYNFVYVRDVATGRYGFPFIKAWFNGGPLLLLRRDALKGVPFRGWRYCKDQYCVTPEAREKGRPVMGDVSFAIDCAKKNIPLMTDVRIFLYHVFGTRRRIKVGKRQTEISFVAAENDRRTKDEVDEAQALMVEAVHVAWNSGGEPIEV